MAADPFAALNKACIKSFGTAVSYQQGTAAPFPVSVIVMKDSDEERHEGRYVRLFVGIVDFITPPDHGDVAIINGVTYTVFEVMADAMGGVTISLRAAA